MASMGYNKSIQGLHPARLYQTQKQKGEQQLNIYGRCKFHWHVQMHIQPRVQVLPETAVRGSWRVEHVHTLSTSPFHNIHTQLSWIAEIFVQLKQVFVDPITSKQIILIQTRILSGSLYTSIRKICITVSTQAYKRYISHRHTEHRRL